MDFIDLSNSALALCIMLGVIALGYIFGRIDIKGIRLGSSGVFIVAIIAGCIISQICGLSDKSNTSTLIGSVNNISNVVKNVGLVMFITSIGYTAGAILFKTIKTGGYKFIVISVAVVIIGFAVTMVIYAIDKNLDIQSALGLMAGSLTSTPGLSSAELAFENSKSVIDTANAVAYPFGVIGACLFVQLVSKISKNSMEESKQKLEKMKQSESVIKSDEEKIIVIDKLGFAVFCLAGIAGIFIGSLTIPGINFNLTTTGGCLISGIIFSMFKKIGKISFDIPKNTLSVIKEFGLVLFLFGSGITGGFGFIPMVQQYPIYFLYGILITTIPMISGFIIAGKIFKMDILTNLGAITGAMTSTPALGALEQASQTEDVVACYTATYPMALFLLVIIPQIIKMFF